MHNVNMYTCNNMLTTRKISNIISRLPIQTLKVFSKPLIARDEARFQTLLLLTILVNPLISAVQCSL